MLDGQKVETPGVDSDRCARLENRSEEEDSGGKHCPNAERGLLGRRLLVLGYPWIPVPDTVRFVHKWKAPHIAGLSF